MIFELIRMLYNKKIETNLDKVEVDWSNQDIFECLTQIHNSGTAAQLYSGLDHSGILVGLPKVFLIELKRMTESSFYQSLLIKNELKNILRVFERYKVPLMLLKGVSFAERMYGHFAARGTSDIDLLIQEEDLDEASACLIISDYSQKGDDPPDHFHYTYSKKLKELSLPLDVELHSRLTKDYLKSMDMSWFWTNAEPHQGYKYIHEMSIEDSFYSICLHGANHLMDSVKYMLDIAQILTNHSNNIHYTQLRERAIADHSYSRVSYAIGMTYRVIPQLEYIKPLSGSWQVKAWTERMGVFLCKGSMSNRRYIRTYVMRMIISISLLDNWQSKWLLLRRIVYPSQEHAHYIFADYHEVSKFTRFIKIYKFRVYKLICQLRNKSSNKFR